MLIVLVMRFVVLVGGMVFVCFVVFLDWFTVFLFVRFVMCLLDVCYVFV